MKKIFTLCSAVIFGATVFAQSNMPGITISPIPTDGTTDITISVDPAQICMPAGKELDAAWPAIGFHGGVILAAGAWQNVVNWDAATAIQLTNDGSGIFSATYNPSTYYSVAAGESILGISFVLNAATNLASGWDGEGKAFDAAGACSDFFVYFAELGLENDAFGKLTVSPNPATASTVFALENQGEATIQLADLAGKIVSTTVGNGTIEVNTSDLNAGTYIYTVKVGDSVKTGKITKN